MRNPESLENRGDVAFLFERIDSKLDAIAERLARVEGCLERHDERSMNHHERIVILEQSQRKATWALAAAGFAVFVALIPVVAMAL